MKITKQRLKEIIKEELQTESVPVPRTWMRHASSLIKQSARHVSEEMGQKLNIIADELLEMVEAINVEQARLPDARSEEQKASDEAMRNYYDQAGLNRSGR